MINIIDKSQCCGCNACVQICPKQCISMKEDEQGFMYPEVDCSICINCGRCDKVCPIINRNKKKEPLKVLAIKNINENQRVNSSSGGIFILLAEKIIEQNGVVFGARFDTRWEVEHCYAETIEQLEPLMGSKYVQSRIGHTYKTAEQFLKQGRKVMFVGSSCQISGLRNFLKRDYENLIAVDFVCHGTPSPGVWREYLKEIMPLSSVSGINFREKRMHGFGWKKYGFVVRGKSHLKDATDKVLLSETYYENIFMRGFISNLYLRPSCYNCTSKNGASGSDLTIADFWGIQKFYPYFDDDKGVSAVFIHTDKGKRIIDKLSSNADIVESNISEATALNPSYYKAVSIPSKYSYFWKTFKKTKSVIASVDISTRSTFVGRIKAIIGFYIRKYLSLKK